MTICILGTGYVGLTLGVTLADVGFNVIGVDIKPDVVEALNRGIPRIVEPHLEFLLRKHLRKRLWFYTEIPENDDIDAYIIAVPTPIDDRKMPINDYIINSITDVAKHLKKGDLVVLRSTVTVGTTRKITARVIENQTGLVAGQDYALVFAPERTAEGVALKELRALPQIIGGIDEESINRAASIFGKVTNTIIRLSSLEAAEIIKLFDNVYRDVSIALGNQFGLACEKLGLDAYEVINAANMNYGRNKIMYPGSNVGGGCLPKDPYIFLYPFEDADFPLIRLARKINESMPMHVVELIRDAFKEMHEEIKGAKILLLGFGFKGEPETGDTRLTAAIDVCRELGAEGAILYGSDPVVVDEEIKRIGAIPCSMEEGCRDADCIVVLNNHKAWSEINLEELSQVMKNPAAVIDGWGILGKSEVKNLGMIFRGVGNG
jgi:UDP-N-acetyl-D-mannosaminuronic acid dehydrogenase